MASTPLQIQKDLCKKCKSLHNTNYHWGCTMGLRAILSLEASCLCPAFILFWPSMRFSTSVVFNFSLQMENIVCHHNCQSLPRPVTFCCSCRWCYTSSSNKKFNLFVHLDLTLLVWANDSALLFEESSISSWYSGSHTQQPLLTNGWHA